MSQNVCYFGCQLVDAVPLLLDCIAFYSWARYASSPLPPKNSGEAHFIASAAGAEEPWYALSVRSDT